MQILKGDIIMTEPKFLHVSEYCLTCIMLTWERFMYVDLRDFLIHDTVLFFV